jgi:hypothetical protein
MQNLTKYVTAFIVLSSVGICSELSPNQFDVVFEEPKVDTVNYFLEAYERDLISIDKLSTAVRFALIQNPTWVKTNISALRPALEKVVLETLDEDTLSALKKTDSYLWGWWIANKGSEIARKEWLLSLKMEDKTSLDAIVSAGGAGLLVKRIDTSVISDYPRDELRLLVKLAGQNSRLSEAVDMWYNLLVEVVLLKKDEAQYKKYGEYLERLRLVDKQIKRELEKLDETAVKTQLVKALWNQGKTLLGQEQRLVLVKFLLPENAKIEERINYSGLPPKDLFKLLANPGEAWLVEKTRPGVWKELSGYLLSNPALVQDLSTQVLNRITEKLIAEKLYEELTFFTSMLLETSATAQSYEYALLKLGESSLVNRDYDKGLEYAAILQKAGPKYVDIESVDRLITQIKYLKGDFNGAYETMMRLYARRPGSIDPEMASRLAAFTGNKFESQLFKYMGEIK